MSAEALSASPIAHPIPAIRSRRAVGLWLFAVCGCIALMVLIGGLTRLTNSGLSITEWRPVTGVVPPLSEAAWQAEFANYQRIPEYTQINRGMSLDAFKRIYWWEWTHRLVGRLTGFVFLIPFLWFLARGRIERGLAPRLAAIFLLGAGQGALGWYMVKSGLVGRTDVSQYRLAAHLGFAFALYGLVLWTALDLAVPAARRGLRSLRGLSAGLFVLVGAVFVQVLLGALVAGLNAGFVYNTWPLMEGRLVPHGLLTAEPWWINLFETVKTVQFDHRMTAYAVTALILGLWLVGRRHALTPRAERTLNFLTILVLCQVALGIATLIHVVPIGLAAAHQLGALAVFTAALIAAHAVLRAAQPAPMP